MNTTSKYIIIDDDEINNIICKMAIESALGEVDITTFEEPVKALEFIQKEYSKKVIPTILFLDINMPTITGWEFLEEFDKFTEDVKNQISIYIVSSSVDPRDKDKAEGNKYIKGFISKPLDNGLITSISAGDKI